MKHLKSSLRDLRELFEHSITVKDIVEPLTSFDADHPADQARLFMEEKDYDVVGVREDGLVSGYARSPDLSGGKLGDYLVQFYEPVDEPVELLPETTPLVKVFEALHDSSRAFVLVLGEVGGIVTRGDLQKIPVRMWLFGLVSLIEMQLLRIIRDRYPDDSWEYLISEGRLKKAKECLEDRRQRNEAIALADCLQFADKYEIVLKNEELRRSLGFESKRSGKRLLNQLKNLRDDLAHGHPIRTGNWPEIIDLAKDAQACLQRCEEIVVTRGDAA